MLALLASIIPDPATDAYFDVRAAWKAGTVDNATWHAYVGAAWAIVSQTPPRLATPLVTFA